MIRSQAFIRETECEETPGYSNTNITSTSTTAGNLFLDTNMVAGLAQSQSWHSLASTSIPGRPRKGPYQQQQQSQHQRTSSASSSRSNSGKSSGYGSSIGTPAHFLNVRPTSKSNGASPGATASAHACRRCGNLLCRWRKTHHNVVVCGAGGVGKSGKENWRFINFENVCVFLEKELSRSEPIIMLKLVSTTCYFLPRCKPMSCTCLPQSASKQSSEFRRLSFITCIGTWSKSICGVRGLWCKDACEPHLPEGQKNDHRGNARWRTSMSY